MKIVIDINGEEVKVAKIEPDEQEVIEEVSKPDPSKYARYFDEACHNWSKDPKFNLMYLQQQQVYANDLLRARGWLVLNEVYRMLGIPESSGGLVAGWVYDEIDKPYIDFGFSNNEDFVNGRERCVLLDFNVQYDDIRKHI